MPRESRSQSRIPIDHKLWTAWKKECRARGLSPRQEMERVLFSKFLTFMQIHRDVPERARRTARASPLGQPPAADPLQSLPETGRHPFSQQSTRGDA